MGIQIKRPKAGKLIFFALLSLLLLGVSSSWAIVVTSTADSGTGSLREAITTANGDGVATVITFDPTVFAPAAPGVISLGSALPNLNGTGDTIDGTGAGVVLDGSALTGAERGLTVRRSNITVRSLTIRNFPNDGVRVETPPPPTTTNAVTGVLVTGNTLVGNKSRGIRIWGGIGPGKTVGATVSNNTVTDSSAAGMLIAGNTDTAGDPGGNRVTVLIDDNTVKRGEKNQGNTRFGGDGINITGGRGDLGSDNVVTATVSNNRVFENQDDGIAVAGCGLQDGGHNNTVYVTIINNKVTNNGGDPDVRNVGIAVAGGGGEVGASSTCVGNTMRFTISNNTSTGNRDANISISGGSGTGHNLQGTVSGNSAKDSPGGDGIVISGGGGTGHSVHDITISGNQVSGNFDRGIQITPGTNSIDNVLTSIDIFTNNVSANVNGGILISGGTNTQNGVISDVNIDGNKSTGNFARGFQVSSGSTTGAINPTISLAGITNNTASSNTDDGIFIGSGVNGAGTTPVSGNRADKNGGGGIEINSTGYVLSNNTASSNAGAGIRAVGNTNGGGNTGRRNASCNTPGCF